MEGFYFDPKHGGCLRRVRRIDESTFRIDGVYGDDEPHTFGHWHAVARVRDRRGGVTSLRVDFGGKPFVDHARFYDAWHDAAQRVIRWQDGNVWTRMFVHRAQLR